MHMRDISTRLFPVLDLLSSSDSVPYEAVSCGAPSSSPPGESASALYVAPSEEAKSPHEKLHITELIPTNAGDRSITEHTYEPTNDHPLRRSGRIGRPHLWL